MADFTIDLDIEDAKVAEALDAFRWHFNAPAATPAQLKQLVKDDVRANLVKIFKAWKKYQLTVAPPSDEIIIS